MLPPQTDNVSNSRITCTCCKRSFPSKDKLKNHHDYERKKRKIEKEKQAQQHLDQDQIMVDAPPLQEPASSSSVPLPSSTQSIDKDGDDTFDPTAPKTFKSSARFGAGDQGHVYEARTLQDHTFTYCELMSIELFDIVTCFNIPTEAHRQLVNLMNTLIRDRKELAEQYQPQILHGNRVDTLLKENTALKAHEYDICPDSCQLYNCTDEDKLVCSTCGLDRYMQKKTDPSVIVPAATMKMMSIGDLLAKMLSNDKTRKELQYRHTRKPIPQFMTDYFDGKQYKDLEEDGFFDSPDDIAIALLVDGFVHQKKSKQQSTIVHIIVLNFDPSYRYTDEYLLQLAIIPGKIKDLDSFMKPIVDEFKSLGKHGLIVKKPEGEVIKSKGHLVMATGDIPQVSKFCHHGGHTSSYGCRICEVKGQSPTVGGGKYFVSRTAALRSIDDFKNSNISRKISEPTVFASLPTFNGSPFFALDEMHFLGHGIDPSNKSKFTFLVNPNALKSAGLCIQESRKSIPVSFQGSWDNLISKIDGARAIDYLDFLLCVVPTLLVPLFERADVRKALLSLVKGCAIALQWDLTESLLKEMEQCFEAWHAFLEAEVNEGNLSVAVFRVNNHYLTHIGYITRQMGNLRSYTTRSMERTIGRYSKLITSRVHSGKHAGNLIERHAIRGFLQFSFDTQNLLDLLTPKKTSLTDYIELSERSDFNQDHQLWSPFGEGEKLEKYPLVSTQAFLAALTKYYRRANYSPNMNFKMAARALINSQVFSSEMYRKIRKEERRGNHYVLFNVSLKRGRYMWYVGAVMFYFQADDFADHKDSRFLALVEVMKEHKADKFDPCIPVIKMKGRNQPSTYAVINLNDIQDQVGLVQISPTSLEYKVVASYKVYNENIDRNAGKLSLI